MVEKICIFNPYKNVVVTSQYVNIIKSALKAEGIATQYISKIEKNVRKAAGIVVISVKDAIISKIAGYFPVILWVQGVVPEESFMKNHNIIKQFILSRIEKEGLKAADYVLFVSQAMKTHYYRKYAFTSSSMYIMPCFNSEFKRSSFYTDGKYRNNIFLYAGGLLVWHCFRETVQLFRDIEQAIPNAHFRVLTREQKEAEKIIQKMGIRNYSIDYVENEKIDDEMAIAKFGFSLREDTIVNNVSTPTKLSTYICNGVMPIYSRHILDFAKQAGNNEYCICSDSDNNYNFERILELCKSTISAEDVYSSFINTFGDYYSVSYHTEELTKRFRDFLGNE